jgi:hypothetical protein
MYVDTVKVLEYEIALQKRLASRECYTASISEYSRLTFDKLQKILS